MRTRGCRFQPVTTRSLDGPRLRPHDVVGSGYGSGCPDARTPLPVAHGWISVLSRPSFTLGSSCSSLAVKTVFHTGIVLQQLGSLLRPDAENLDPAYFARIAGGEQPSNRAKYAGSRFSASGR